MKPHLALFDLDHTLLPLDSDYAWGEFTQRIGWTDPVVFKRRNDEFYADYQAGRLDIHEYVRFATESVRLKGQVQAEAARAQFLREVIQPAVRPEAQALIQRHRDQGCQVMIVTATNEFVTRPIAQLFGIDELIAVELARDAQGWITGEIAGVPFHARGQGPTSATMAAGAWLGLAGRRDHLLQRFHQRPAAAGSCQPPGGHQSR